MGFWSAGLNVMIASSQADMGMDTRNEKKTKLIFCYLSLEAQREQWLIGSGKAAQRILHGRLAFTSKFCLHYRL